MQVKRFEGADMQEVLRLVKQELGPHAVILSTRHIKKGKGSFGMFGRPMVEVTAAVDRDDTAPSDRGAVSRRRQPAQAAAVAPGTVDLIRALDPLQREMDHIKELLQQLATRERFAAQVKSPVWERDVVAVKHMLERLVQSQQDAHQPLLAPALMPFYQRLLSSGLDEILARRLTERVQNSIPPDKLGDTRYVRGYVASTLIKAVPLQGPLRPAPETQMVVALVGPTGVGKTTTIAKLAAHFALAEKKKVALLTLDTYRIAAVEQLRIFAKILGLPVDVVLTPAELEQTLTTHGDKEVVLIDTAGRSQRDDLQMAELLSFFGTGHRGTVHLVLSATASAQNLLETVERFKPLQPASLIFTKLDESNTYGTVLGTALRGTLPLSYFTTGQRVPEDIEVATPERLVDLILNVSQWQAEEPMCQEGTSA